MLEGTGTQRHWLIPDEGSSRWQRSTDHSTDHFGNQACETMNNPKYLLYLLLRGITVALETLKNHARFATIEDVLYFGR